MHATLAKFKALIRSLALLVALCVPHAVAQDFTVNLKDTDIQEFIEFVADVTETTIVVDPSVKAKSKSYRVSLFPRLNYTTCFSI